MNDQMMLMQDAVNIELIAALQSDPAASRADLARRVGMSAPAVGERVRRLEEAGVIVGRTLELDPAALGLPVTAFVRIRPTAGQLPKLAQLAVDTPSVSECYRITGEDCFLLKMHAPTIQAIEDALDRFLLHGNTVASLVVSTPVSRRPLPLPEPQR